MKKRKSGIARIATPKQLRGLASKWNKIGKKFSKKLGG